MLALLSITFPIFALIALGYGCTLRGLFDARDMRSLGRFVVQVALPALIFNAVSKRDLGQIFNAGYLLAYLGGSLLVVALGWLILRRVSGLDRVTRILSLMGMSCSNSGFIGYPILLLTFGGVAEIALALNMMVENLIMIPAFLAALEIASGPAGETPRQIAATVLRRLVRQPLMLALVAGLVVALTHLTLPTALDRTLGMLALASAALSLFVIGGSLAGLPRGTSGPLTWSIVAGKLVLHPLAVALMLWLIPLTGIAPITPKLAASAVLMAAVPMMGIYPILAQAHGRQGMASMALLIGVICSFATLNLVLALVT